MKVFVSHSSKDKWAARRISGDIKAMNIETFLDEKDIFMGQSIDDSIRRNLKDCDDFLLLLSPASLKSEWVLLELGGALALGKRVIPILLYVGANELPQAISLKLSRDINEINGYYSELEERKTGKAKTIESVLEEKQNFKVGDTVRVVNKIPKDIYRQSKLIDWEDEMDRFLDGTFKVYAISEYASGTYELESANTNAGYFIFAEEWLTKI